MTTSDECPPIGSTARRKAVSGSGAVSSLGHVEEAMRPMPDQGGRRISTQHGVGDLLAANQSIVGELSLPLVLRRIVEAAAKVLGARYAALGVLGPDCLLGQADQALYYARNAAAIATLDLVQRRRDAMPATAGAAKSAA